MGFWEALLIGMASSAAGAGASAAASPETEGRSSGIGSVPKIEESPDPWSWFAQLQNKGGM